ncbi:MAG: DNA polymerase III subunit delta [Jatrophihabitantaceae bacterium]
MPPRPVSLDELPVPLPAVVLLVGDEELLVGRAISALSAAARRQDAQLVDVERLGSELEGPELHELLGPSLFGDGRLVVIRSAQDVRTAALAVLKPYLELPSDGTVIVLHHLGGAKGNALLAAARKAKALEIGCAKLARAEDRAEFVRAEVRHCGGVISPDAVAALVDAVGSDLRELAAVSAQLVSDSGGSVGVELVRAYHTGRAEVSGFAVADLAVVGNAGKALEALRFALGVGVPHVVIADALADGMRSIARVASAGRADPYALASKLGMPAWKVKRAQGQARGWTEPGVRRALGIVAELNADVKGVAADPSYALERAVRRLTAARSVR